MKRGDDEVSHEIRIPIKQPVFHGNLKVHSGKETNIAICWNMDPLNESMYVFPIEHGDIPASRIIIQKVGMNF